MNRREKNPEEMLDRIIGEIRDERVDNGQVEEAAAACGIASTSERTRSGRLATVRDFQALIPAYRDGLWRLDAGCCWKTTRINASPAAKCLFGEAEALPKVVEIAGAANDAGAVDGDRGICNGRADRRAAGL